MQIEQSNLPKESPERKEKHTSLEEAVEFFRQPKVRELFEARIGSLIEEILELNPRVLVMLDKAARPLYWALNEAWKNDERTQGKKLPTVKFLNFGQAKEIIFPEGKEGFRQEPTPYNYTDKFHELFVDEETIKDLWKDFGDDKKMMDMLPDFYEGDGPVLIVDDYEGSGSTVKTAKSFLQFQFPDLEYMNHAIFYGLDSIVLKNKKKAMNGTWLPWFNDKSYTMVADDETPGTVFSKPDSNKEDRKDAIALRKEIISIFKK